MKHPNITHNFGWCDASNRLADKAHTAQQSETLFEYGINTFIVMINPVYVWYKGNFHLSCFQHFPWDTGIPPHYHTLSQITNNLLYSHRQGHPHNVFGVRLLTERVVGSPLI
jgi:hypothetical protein